MRKLSLITFLWMGMISISLAQVNSDPAWNNYAIASPDNGYLPAAMNEATGQAQIGIPLFQFDNFGFKQSISLNYRTGGFKVDESASKIGMGWSLSAGGSITKVICGLPDEQPLVGYNSSAAQTAIGQITYHTCVAQNYNFDQIYKGELDGESDYYMYNAPGISGKYFVNNATAYSLPYSGVKIEEGTFLGVSESFKITDNNGIEYYYTEKEYLAIETTSSLNLSPEASYTKLLTKIKLLNGIEINFNYSSEYSYTVKGGTYQSQIIKIPAGNTCLYSYENFEDVNSNQVVYKYRTKRLTNISMPSQQVYIVYNSIKREDIPEDYAISSIDLKGNNGNLLKRFVFSQYYGISGADVNSKRLMLESFREYSSNGIDAKQPYSFEYNGINLPAPGACSQDLYGYYNGENISWTNNGWQGPFPIMLQAMSVSYTTASTQLHTANIYGATRLSNVAYSKAMSLNAITFPGGGKTMYEYEPHTLGINNTVTSGLRIKKITVHDGNGPVSYKHYSYSNGILVALAEDQVLKYNKRVAVDCVVKVYKRFTTPAKTVPGIYDAPVYYGSVTLKESSDESGLLTNGSVVSTYYAEELKPPVETYIISCISGEPTTSTTGYSGILHLKPFFYGNLLNRKIYKNDNITLVDEITYEYNTNEGNKSYRYAVYPRINMVYPGSVNSFFLKQPLSKSFYAVKIYSQIFHLKKVIHKSFGTSGSTFSTTTNEYFYEPAATAKHLAVSENKTTFDDGSTTSSFYKYCADYNTTTAIDDASIAIQQLKNNNQQNYLIEQIIVKNSGATNERCLGASLREFSKVNASLPMVEVKKEYIAKRLLHPSGLTFTPSSINAGNFSFDSHYNLLADVDQYNSFGQVTSQQQKGISSAQIIDPIWNEVYAKAENALINEIAYIGFESYEMDKPLVYDPVNFLPSVVTGNWNLPHGISTCLVVSDFPFAGAKSLNLSGTCVLSIVNLSLATTRKYKLSLWCKSGVPLVTAGSISVTGKLIQTTSGWNLYEFDFMGAPSVTIQGSCFIDEVKLRPVDASMETVIWNSIGLKIASVDNDNNYTYYEYDELNRLVKVRDYQKNILKKIEYTNQQTQN